MKELCLRVVRAEMSTQQRKTAHNGGNEELSRPCSRQRSSIHTNPRCQTVFQKVSMLGGYTHTHLPPDKKIVIPKKKNDWLFDVRHIFLWNYFLCLKTSKIKTKVGVGGLSVKSNCCSSRGLKIDAQDLQHQFQRTQHFFWPLRVPTMHLIHTVSIHRDTRIHMNKNKS